MKTVLIIGHCSYDGPRLAKVVLSVHEDVNIVYIATAQQTLEYIQQHNPADLLLINRIFAQDNDEGISLISTLHQTYPQLKLMLISNYDDAQQQAQQAGAITGFGKYALKDKTTKQLLQDALE